MITRPIGGTWLVLSMMACSGGPIGHDAGAGEDASVDGQDGGVVEPEPPAPPAPPAPPEPVRMTPCPEGWREVADRDDPSIVTCDPWPEGGRRVCAEDEAHFPGRPGCERIGPACPEGEWPADIPEGARVLYVRAGEAEGGDGTQERPFGWIADAVEDAEDGDVIALSKGLYDESVRIDRVEVTLLGACVLETRIAPSVPGREPAVLTVRTAVVVRDLQVGGAVMGLDVAGRGGMAELDSVLVRGATVAGVRVWSRGTLTATDLVVADTHAQQSDGEFGYGLEASGGSQVSLERAAFERNRTVGVLVAEEGTTLAAADLVVADTQARESDGHSGVGLLARRGAQVSLERAAFVRNRDAGMVVGEEGTALVAADLVVTDTQARESDGDFGYGLGASAGAQVTLERAALERNRAVGVLVAEEGTVLAAADLVVADTQARAGDGDSGDGLHAFGGAQVTLERAAFERNLTIGVNVDDEGTALAAADLVVADTQARESNGDFGYGLEASRGAQVSLQRAAFERNRTVGVVVFREGTALEAADLSVTDTLSKQVDGQAGLGLAVEAGGAVKLTRARLADNRSYGLRARGPQASVIALDLLVERTAVQQCGIDTCSDWTGGFGIASEDEASLDVRRFRSADNALVGVLVSGGGLDLHEGVVAGNQIGANVQEDDYDLDRLQDEVLYIDNVINSNRQRIPLPPPLESLDLDVEDP